MSSNCFILWLPMILIAFINATLREFVFINIMNELRAHQMSTITLSIFCAIYVWYIFPFMKLENVTQALMVGFVWVILTAGFEFTLGIFLKKRMSVIFRDYNLKEGRLWPAFLLWLFILPFIFFQIRK